MPKDDWKPQKDAQGRERHYAERKSSPGREPMKASKDVSIGQLKKMHNATLVEQEGRWLISIPRPGDDTLEGVIRVTINELGYNFRASKKNPVQLGENAITIDAAQFLEKCEQKGWDYSPLIDEATAGTLRTTPKDPTQKRLGPGGEGPQTGRE